jgi:hypothetical protein
MFSLLLKKPDRITISLSMVTVLRIQLILAPMVLPFDGYIAFSNLRLILCCFLSLGEYINFLFTILISTMLFSKSVTNNSIYWNSHDDKLNFDLKITYIR